jgi:hypothetical protein
MHLQMSTHLLMEPGRNQLVVAYRSHGISHTLAILTVCRLKFADKPRLLMATRQQEQWPSSVRII